MMEKGLTSHEVLDRQRVSGKNEIVSQKSASVLSLFTTQIATFINGILLIAAFFSFIIGDSIDGGFILAIILLNAIFGFIQEYRAEKSLEKLQAYTVPVVRVIRDGKQIQIDAKSLVPGDVIVLSEGDRIPADCSVIESHHVEIDEAILTGESLPVEKNIGAHVYLGTLALKGKGLLRVEKIGMQTRFGEIAHSLTSIKNEKTPLQKNLASLGKILSLVILGIAALIIPLGIMQGKEPFPLLLTAISIGVAAIPEGLPAVITIALAIGTNRMAKQRTIVRKMPSVETLGAVQIILVDKTGTLTENVMRVKSVWLPEKQELPMLLRACTIGNTASLIQKADTHGFDIVGDKTDGSLLLYAKEQAADTDLSQGKIVDEYVFDSQTRMITTVWENAGKQHVFARGAPEVIIAKSNAPSALKKKSQEIYEQYAKDGLRVIAFGTKEIGHTKRMGRKQLEDGLTLLGIIGIYDPPRDTVRQAIQQAKQAGIKTIMVTGDNELTALAIAKEIGLIDKDEDVMTGPELETLSDHELAALIAKSVVFARTRPQDKLRITTILQQQGYVVGVTGDGVNDAPALKKANVGVAMGKSGTDVAKEASDIIITDDNFATLMKAIEEGRNIYRNILTAITYLLSGNLSELSLIFFAALAGMPSPLLPTQILWINIVTDGLPALALATDSKHPSILREKPRDPHMPILTKQRVLLILTIGLALSVGLLVLFQLLLASTSLLFARTVIFNTLILSHLFIAFLLRGRSFFKINKFLVISALLTIVLQGIITLTPFFQDIFHLGP